MAIKIKSNINLKKQLQGASSKSSRAIKKASVKIILDSYNKGLSPVKGFNKYKAYRPATKKKGNVTLKETGELHNSLVAIQKKARVITLLFKGARNQKISGYHQFGTSKMAKRPMLPLRGQQFKEGIKNKFIKLVDKVLSQALK